MGNSAYVPMAEIISAAFNAIDHDDSRDEMIFADWAYDAVKEIGLSRIEIDTECVDVVDLCIDKPRGFWSLVDLNLMDDIGCKFFFQMTEKGIMETEPARMGITVSEQDSSLHLSSVANDAGITKAEITFYRVPVDEYGDLLVRDICKNAVIAYIEFMYMKRMMSRSHKNMPLNKVDWYLNRWNNLARKARGQIKMPDAATLETVSKRWVTRIPNFQRKSIKRIGLY